MAAEQRDHVVVVALRLEIHEQRRLAVHPQGAGREHGAFDAVGPALAQDFAHRQAGLAADFEIGGNGVEKPLDFRRSGKPGEDQELGTGKAQVFSAGKMRSQLSAPENGGKWRCFGSF